ncbi:MAG TPA: hypothetical protein VJ992_09195 [Gemmatimonadales bacterium]|nr:hypothetical protein [Gemmatimonadales bacterium]
MHHPISTYAVRVTALAAPIWLLALGGCGSSTTSPTQNASPTGSIKITAATTGTDLWTNTYSVYVDGSSHGTVPANGTATVDSLSVGDHQVSLSGFSENCGADSAGPRTVTVAADQSATVTFNVTCVADVGTLKITTSTDGLAIDADGYVIVAGTDTLSLNATDTAIADVAPGTVTITLTGQAANCTPHGTPQTSASVTFGDTTNASFALTCFADPIVFERRSSSGRNDLYVVDASGGTEVKLTDATAQFYSFTTGPNGGSPWNATKTMLVYQSSGETDYTNYDEYVIALNKSVSYHLTRPAPQFAPSWSPDGAHVAFASYEPSGSTYNAAIDVAGADLTGVSTLTPTNVWSGGPVWSHDGTRLLFWVDSTSVGGPNATIGIMNANGTGWVNVSNADGTRNAAYGDYSPSWSPDDSRVVFTRDYASGGFATDIWVANQDGTGLTRLTTDSTIQKENPTWSPDGSQIYFERCGDSTCRGQDVWVMNADGTNQTKLTTSHNEHLGSFNPAGTELVTWDVMGTDPNTQSSIGQLFIQGLDGSNRAALTAAGVDAENPHWR